MCGRYALYLHERELEDAFHIAVKAGDLRVDPSWNVAPMQTAPIVTASKDDGALTLRPARWGLVPPWAKDDKVGARMINARAETVAEKPSFRAAFKRGRCLVPASGYYEWKPLERGKQPYFIRDASSAPLAFAGLWESWGSHEKPLVTFSVITRAARGSLADIHDREPVMLNDAARDAWLAAEAGPDELHGVLAAGGPECSAHPVGSEVGNVRNNQAGLIEPLA